MINKPLILVVDDEPKNIRLVSEILKDLEANVSVALDASRARKILDTIVPDLILLDIMMPTITGFELCEEIKKKEKLSRIPIVFLTAKASLADTRKGFELGAVDYILKPFRKEELIARLKIHLKLYRTQEELRNRLREKNEIVGMVAHDLKSPIFAITAFTNALEEDLQENEEQKETLDLIKQATAHMQDIVKRILTLEELEQRNDLSKQEFYDISKILEATIALNEPHAKEKKISLDVEIMDSCFVQGNEFRVKEMMDNFISNAVKYSQFNSKVTIQLKKDKENKTSFVIQDEGPGFTEKDKTKIFGKFQKLSAKPTGGEHSTGLGLYIARKLISEMNGSIELESPIKETKGSRFTITIPSLNPKL